RESASSNAIQTRQCLSGAEQLEDLAIRAKLSRAASELADNVIRPGRIARGCFGRDIFLAINCDRLIERICPGIANGRIALGINAQIATSSESGDSSLGIPYRRASSYDLERRIGKRKSRNIENIQRPIGGPIV